MRNDLTRIRRLATDIVLMADNLPQVFSVDGVREIAEEIAVTAGRLVEDIIAVERAEILAEDLRCI